MSTRNRTTDPSTSNFTAIFDAASQEYKTLTRQDLAKHPFAAALQGYSSPYSILGVFRDQAQAFDKFRQGDDKLMASLTPIVNILFTFSETLGEGVGLLFSPAKTIFTGIGVLLGGVRDVIASYEVLVNLFERIQFFLQRLNRYAALPLTPEMTVLLGKIMAQVLSILALSTKAMKERRIKKFMKRLAGRTDLEDALQRLDVLTKEENLMTAARNLEVTHRVDVNVTATQELTRNIHDNVEVTNLCLSYVETVMDEQQRKQLRTELRTWLSPPNTSVNHNTACDIQHEGTAAWFIQGSKFQEWKKNGSLLWIRGNPGSGKSILCSAIIEDIRHMQDSRSALVAYYYCDFKDVTKRDVRGLLTSLLLQLVDDSDSCWDTLHQLYKAHRDGSAQPGDTALVKCLGSMIDLPGQVPIYLIVDALDECPNDTGTPSAREKVLNFVRDLFRSDHSNLFVCITSRPEQDISATLNSLTSPSNSVSLHEERGQRQDIDNFVRSFVQTDAAMRRWREEDKELVVNVLSERAGGMFRWVFCQLDTLRRCMPSSIRKVLNELPTTLDDTYERMLQGIPKEKFQHASRLFQCMVAALRPLRVEELAEIFAIEFGANDTLNLVVGWRPENPEEAVLSTCSTFITIIDDQGSKIAQFSHFSVKEFLTSDRLQMSDVGNIGQYYIPLEPAHAILARSCVAVLVQLDEEEGDERFEVLPLASYAAENWVRHAQFEDVASRIFDTLAYLFNPKEPHFRPRILLQSVKTGNYPYPVFFADNPDKLTPLFLAAFCGFSGLMKHLIVTQAPDVNEENGDGWSPLPGALLSGQVDCARILLDHGADMNAVDRCGYTSLHYASCYDHFKVTRFLLEHGANLNAQTADHETAMHLALREENLEIVRLLLDHGADVTVQGRDGRTPFQVATHKGHHDVAQLLLEHGAERVGGHGEDRSTNTCVPSSESD